MKITAKTKICLIVGDPVAQSLSPQMHNAAYETIGIDDQFVYLAAHVSVNDIKQTIDAVKLFGIRGLTCTHPHKIEVMKYLDEENIDHVAKKIGAVNTVVNEHGTLKGYNTDWLGVITPLEKVTSLDGKRVAILGAGGAARAAVYGVLKKGSKVTIFNRTLANAQKLAEEFGCDYLPMTAIEKIKDMDIIFNATAVGLNTKDNQTPLPKDYITKNHIVFDAVYVPYQTTLLKEAEEQGAKIIHGLEMLLYQGVAQFELYTDHNAPVELMRKILLENSKGK